MALLNRSLVTPTPPFLAWVGGKRHLVNRLLRFLPEDLHKRVYHEPFLGSASLFFATQPSRAFLSDANGHLIQCYKFVRDNPDRVADYLAAHSARDSRDYYYQVRRSYNRLFSRGSWLSTQKTRLFRTSTAPSMWSTAT